MCEIFSFVAFKVLENFNRGQQLYKRTDVKTGLAVCLIKHRHSNCLHGNGPFLGLVNNSSVLKLSMKKLSCTYP